VEFLNRFTRLISNLTQQKLRSEVPPIDSKIPQK